MNKQKTKKSVFKIISDVLFGLIAAFVLALVVISFVEKKTDKSIFGKRVVWVMTESMEDTIPAQSYILVKDVGDNKINVGDVIMFISRDPEIYGANNTHRVIDINDQGEFITKGDHNRYKDEYTVKLEDVQGIYERNLPFLTFIGRLYATPVGYVVTLVLVSGLVGAWFVVDYKEKKKIKKQELMDEMVAEEVKRLEEEAKNKAEK